MGTTVGNIQALTLGIPDLDFTVVDGSTCTPGTTGTACTVNIHFLPRAPGVRRGAVVLYNNASPPEPLLTVPLYAIADSPLAALAPTTPTMVSTWAAAPPSVHFRSLWMGRGICTSGTTELLVC